MADFNPVLNFTQGLQAGQGMRESQRQNQIRALQDALAGQASQASFNPSQSLEFQQLAALDPTNAANQLAVFQSLGKDRQKAFFLDARQGRRMLESGDIEGVMNLANNRLEMVKQLGGDPSDTLSVLGSLQNGDIEGAYQQLSMAEQAGIDAGFLEAPKVDKAEKTAEQLERELRIKEQQAMTDKEALELRRQELEQRQIEAGRPKLSAAGEKMLMASQDRYIEAGNTARQMENLADDISKVDIGAGASATFTEMAKRFLGTENSASELRRKFAGIRASQVVDNLPPGAASDKDIEMALSGFPGDNANAETLVSYLRGNAKLARLDEEFNRFRADYISQNDNTKGLIKAWNDYLPKYNRSTQATNIDVKSLSDEDLFK